jgi:hypothetical protein
MTQPGDQGAAAPRMSAAAEQAWHEAWYRHHQLLIERDTDWIATSAKAGVDFAMTGIRALLLANGGAAVALLAFLGNVWQSPRGNVDSLVTAVQPAMLAFVLGAGLAILTSGLSYLAQTFFTSKKKKPGTALQVAALVSGIASLSAFGWGAVHAAGAFLVVPR